MKTIAYKFVATFVYNAGAILPASSILGGWPVWKAAVVAGVSSCVELAVRESKQYLESVKEVAE